MLGAASPVVQMPLKLHVTLSGGGRTLSLRGRASGRTSHTHGFATCRGRLGGEGRGSGEGQLGWGWPAGWRAATPGDAGEEGRSPSRGHAVSMALSGPPRPPAGAGGRRASPGLGLAWTHVRSGRRPTDTPRPAPMPATCPPPGRPSRASPWPRTLRAHSAVRGLPSPAPPPAERDMRRTPALQKPVPRACAQRTARLGASPTGPHLAGRPWAAELGAALAQHNAWAPAGGRCSARGDAGTRGPLCHSPGPSRHRR